ncbi:hypothetical protein [Actinokineospora enzanensis]|uniref:hypothetical protein n=1 Tax=Actinokineospora enzanensis TaxID=155975 RepID=UPI0012EB4224|nr:hypothetical protein [Actinokineospora enzanensis]
MTWSGGFSGAVAAEWTKTWSIRSTYWCLVAAATLMVAMVVPNGIAMRSQVDNHLPGAQARAATQLPVEATTYVVQFALLALVVLLVAGEYGNGQARATVTWIPVRWRIPAAKAVVLASVSAVVGFVLSGIGVLLADLTLEGRGLPYTAGDVVASGAAIALYLGFGSVVAVVVGTLVRSVAGSLVILFLLLMVVPMMLQATGVQALIDLSHYLPGMAGIDLMERTEALRGAVVLAAWSFGGLALGMFALRRRDA